MTRHTTDDRPNRRETTQRTMGEVTHTNPKTGETFGDSRVFERGKVAIVDGGTAKAADEAEATDGDETEDGEEEAMGDIDHTPRENAPSTKAVYTRGKGASETDSDADADEDDPNEEPV
jgi:hypothetical protein